MPFSKQAMQRPDLGAVAYETILGGGNQGFIGMNVMPIFDTVLQSAEYPVIPTEALLKSHDTSRSARGSYNRDTYDFILQNFSCKENGHEELLDDSEASLYARYFDAESVAVERGSGILLRSLEQRIADIAQNTANAAGTAPVANAWSNPATATPKADVKDAISSLRNASGIKADTAVMGYDAFQNVLVTNELKTYLQYTSPHLVESEDAQKQVLARYLGVRQVLVGDSVKDSAKKGKATVITDIWDNAKVCVMKLSSGGQDLKEPAFGRTFLWTADSPSVITTETYRAETQRSNVYRVRQYTDEAVQFIGANYILTGI